MAWIILTVEVVRPLLRLSPAEVEVINNIVLGGQEDTLGDIITELTEEIRGYVAGYPSNAVGPDGTIPSRLKASAAAVVRFRYLNAYQETQSYLTDQRVTEYKDAWSTISIKVPNGSFRIDTPSTPSSDENPQGPAPVIGFKPRNFTSRSQDGIL